MAVLREDRFRRHPGNNLLTAEAEVGLAVLLRGGTDRVGQEPEGEELGGLPPDDIGVRAWDCLVLHNQRLVHSLIRSCLDQGLEYEDLVQHGVLGLMRAARKFDPAKGYKFSTYATWWVRRSVSRAIADEGALIRVPVNACTRRTPPRVRGGNGTAVAGASGGGRAAARLTRVMLRG
jgi:RNA polymerase primary sigma factor